MSEEIVLAMGSQRAYIKLEDFVQKAEVPGGDPAEIVINSAIPGGDPSQILVGDIRDKAMSGDLVFVCDPDTDDAEIVDQNVGVKQVMTATVSGIVAGAGAGDITVTVTAAGMPESPVSVPVTLANDDDANAIALAIQTALAADDDIEAVSGFWVVTGAGAEVIFTRGDEAANDATFDMTITADTAAFTEGNDAAVDDIVETTAGVAPYTRTVAVSLETAEGDVHTWFNGVVPVTIADNADGAASIVTTNPVMANGQMSVVVTLQGDWVAAKTNTLSVSQKTILGYTVAAVTSVETSQDTP